MLGLSVLALTASPAAAQPPPDTPQFRLVERDGVQEAHVRTALGDYVFSSQGGTLKSAYLHFTPIGMSPVELVPATETTPEAGGLRRSYVKGGLFPFELVVGGRSTAELVYDLEPERSHGQVTLRFTAEVDGLRVAKTFVLMENPYYALRFHLALENATGAPLALPRGVRLSLGQGVGPSPAVDDQARYLIGGAVETRPLESQELEGLGFVGDGLVLFLKALSQERAFSPFMGKLAPDRRALGIELSSLSLAPGASRTYAFELYAGRAKYTLLQHEGLGQLAPPGFFDQFIIPIVQLLDWLYGLTGNYGWAILLFTLITRIVLFPLTRKQFHSMAAMAEMRPKLEKLQQRYPTLRRLKELHPNMSQEELIKRDRENRRALQEKMMELYREEGVNPLGGCLPMLIQLPILIILWRAILYSAETIHLSPGFLWMPDLALHDPTYIIVGLTAVLMMLQTKTTPTMTTTSQGPNQLVFMLFSVGLMVLFLRDFPAGLWLYYFLTTLVQVGQQVFITWEMQQLRLRKEAAAEAPGDGSGESEEQGAKERSEAT